MRAGSRDSQCPSLSFPGAGLLQSQQLGGAGAAAATPAPPLATAGAGEPGTRYGRRLASSVECPLRPHSSTRGHAVGWLPCGRRGRTARTRLQAPLRPSHTLPRPPGPRGFLSRSLNLPAEQGPQLPPVRPKLASCAQRAGVGPTRLAPLAQSQPQTLSHRQPLSARASSGGPGGAWDGSLRAGASAGSGGKAEVWVDRVRVGRQGLGL